MLRRICELDQERKHVVISLTDLGVHGGALAANGTPVLALGMPRGRITWTGLLRLYQLLKQERPDVVQTWMYHADLVGGFIARIAGIRSVVWGVRHSDFTSATSVSTRLVARLCAVMSYVLPRRIVSCAERAILPHIALGYDRSKFVTIPNGYDIVGLRPDDVARRSLRQTLGLEPADPLIAFVGRWNPQKDHKNLIGAIARLRPSAPRITCILVGAGCDEANSTLAKWIADAQLQDCVRLLGRRSDIDVVMNAADLHVLSSAFGEAFPNVVAEAMACGTPCVVTDVGDAAYIVGDTGWVVPPRDEASLATAIASALQEMDDEAQWSKRQTNCRRRIVDNFAFERMLKRFGEVWSEAAERPSAPSVTARKAA